MKIHDIELTGVGPFALPMIAACRRVEMGDGLSYLTLELKFLDGREVHIPIANQASRDIANQLVLALENKQMPTSSQHH